jgi:hypothetical protein
MIRAFLIVSVLCCFCWASALRAVDQSATGAATNPASEASIKQLLEVMKVHQSIENVEAQMDGFIKNTMAQATQGQPVSPKVQQEIDHTRSETMSTIKEILTWDKLEPMYVRIYQKSLNQQDVDGMIGFYKTPAGQAVINKLPLVMQNTLAEVQQMMKPVMEKLAQRQQAVVAEIQAEKGKKG